MTTQMAICIGIWVLMLVVMALDKFDYGAVAIGIGLLLVVTGCIDAPTALSKFSDANAIIMPTMMIVATAFSKTRAVGSIAGLLSKVSGGNFNRAVQTFMIINLVLGVFVPGAIGRIAIVYPLAVALCAEHNVSPSKVMFPLAVCMLADQTGIPLGSGAVVYNRYNGYLQAAGYSYGDAFQIMDPFLAKGPVVIVMMIYFLFFSMKFAPDTPPRPITGLNISKRETEQMEHKNEIITYIIFAIVCVGLVLSSNIGIPQWVFTLGGAVAICMFGVLPMKGIISAIPFSITYLYVGALIMGAALQASGAGQWIGNLIAGTLGSRPSTVVLYAAFWLLTLFFTQFMNNAATANLFIPIAILTCNTIGCSALGVVLIIQMASLVAYFTPMATAIIPIIMGAGGYDNKSLIKQGLVPAVLNTVVGVSWVAFMFPAW
jgi:sodium-dependent dicarboxylate transporter 2/3/5